MCALAEGLLLDGAAVRLSRPLLAVFDSGLGGVVLSRSLLDEPRAGDGAARGLDAVASVDVALRTESGARRVIRADLREAAGSGGPRLRVQAVRLDWFAFGTPAEEERPHVVALGMAALGAGVLTVDVDAGRAAFDVT